MPNGDHLSELNKKRRKNYVVQKFGKLTVLSDDGMNNKSHAYKCLCDCGNIRGNVNGYELKRGHINSCGCSYPKGHFKPGKTKEEYHEHVKRCLLEKRNIVGECWEWTAQLDDKGYGRRTFTIDGKKAKRPVHQTAYRLWKGEISKGLHVCHTCDNPKCFNPDHLWLGTAKDNLQDMIAKGRSTIRKGQDGGKSKLKNEDVLEIRKMYSEGVSMASMGRKYNVTTACIDSICKRKNWKHI